MSFPKASTISSSSRNIPTICAAVAAFLQDRIPFYGITDVVGECIECVPFVKEPSVEDIFKTNEEIYSLAQRKIEGIAKKG